MTNFNNKVWDGFSKWAEVVDNRKRIAQVYKNDLAVNIFSDESFFGKTVVVLSKGNMTWRDNGDFVWGDNFVFVNSSDGTLYPMSSEEVYREISLISKKLADTVKLILS